MSRRRHTPEQIITALRQAEVGLANGRAIAMVSRDLGISEQTYYRWRRETDRSSQQSWYDDGWPQLVCKRYSSTRAVRGRTAITRASTES